MICGKIINVMLYNSTDSHKNVAFVLNILQGLVLYIPPMPFWYKMFNKMVSWRCSFYSFYSWFQWLMLIQPLGWQLSHWTMFIKHNGNFTLFLAMRHKKTYRYICHQPRKFSWWQIVRMLYWRNDIVNDCKWCVTMKPSMQTCSEFTLYILILSMALW